MTKITILIVIATFSVLIGLFLLFDFPLLLRRKKGKEQEKEKKKSRFEETKDISDYVNYYLGKKGDIVKERLADARATLDETGRSGEMKRVVMSCVVLACVGAVAGFIIGNVIVLVILACGMAMIPLWKLKLYRHKYRKYLAAQLESTVSMITTSYIRCSDIIQATTENLDQIPPLLQPFFRLFLTECRLNYSTKACVRDLRDRINDEIFKEWCETLIRTLDDSEMKEALLPICQKYSNVRTVQEEIDIEVMSAITEYVVMIAMVVGCYPLVWLLNKDWFAYYGTFSGGFIIAYSCLVTFFSLAKLISVMQPVQYRR